MSKAQVATDIVDSSANRLCLDMRFLTMAVLSLERRVEPGEGRPACDGKSITFHEDTVISEYREDPNLVTRDLAHCVMHCILGHANPSAPPSVLLAEDMVAEYVIDSLNTPHVAVDGRDDRMYACEKIFRRAGAPAPDLVASELDRASGWQVELYSRMFTRDDGTKHADSDAAAWRELAQQAMTEVEGFVRDLGGTEAFLSIMRIRNRRKADYRAFLRRFMAHRTTVRESMDEFDPIFYTYGLRTYGNVPLMDSLEHSESHRLEELVIAIDTSGSTLRGPVQAFLEEAFSMLRQCGASEGVNLHVVQCDDQVRSDDVIRSEADIKRLAAGFRLRGGKGTDFRPVFRYVDELVENGEFKHLRGLLYFTDGKGTYPERRPAYDTAFVFCVKGYEDRGVPPWAMKVTIRESELATEGGYRRTYRMRRTS